MITVAVRWYLRYGLSYRDVEELLAERGIEVDHVTVYRWVHRYTALFADAARPLRHATGDRWFVNETYVKIAGRWRYLYRSVDQYGQVIDVLLSEQRDTAGARRFFTRALRHGPAPVEVTTDKAGPYLRVIDELVPTAAHVTEQVQRRWSTGAGSIGRLASPNNDCPRSKREEEPVKLSEFKTHDDVVREQLADPEFREEWDPTALARTVAERIVTYRTEHELSQTALARLLKMQQPAVARLESGEHTPSLDTLWRLASRLGIEFHIDITARGVAL